MSKITIKDFSKGITDDIVDADPRFAQKMDNLLLNRLGRPYQRPGLISLFEDATQIPPGNQRVDAIFTFDQTTFIKSSTKLYYYDRSEANPVWTELSTLSSKAAFGDSILGAGVSWSVWRGHVIATPLPYGTANSGCRTIWIFRHSTNLWACEQVGVPAIADAGFAGAAVGSGGTDDKSYIAAVVLRHKHFAKVDGVTCAFVEYGQPGLVGVRNEEVVDAATGFSLDTINWTNGTLDNYTDASSGNSSLRVALYRTKANDSTLLLSDIINQGSTSLFEDPDSFLGSPANEDEDGIDSIELYTTGGRKENGPVPLCLYSLVLDGYGFYGAYVEPASGVMYHNRVVQSNPAVPTGVYAGNYVEFEGAMRGFGRVGSYPIIVTTLGARRIEGRFDAFGGGGMKTYLIPGSAPGLSGKAIVQLDDAIIYASTEGWIWTNGFQASNISEHLKETYSTFPDPENMSACYDAKKNLVHFGVNDPAADDENVNNRCYVIDMRASEPTMGVFTTVTSEAQPNALHYDRDLGLVLIGDQRGFVFTYDDETYCDVRVSNAALTGTKRGITWDYISVGLSKDPGTETFASKVYATFTRITGALSAQISTFKNFNLESASKVVRDRAISGIHRIERWVSGGRWATYHQIRIKKAEVFIINSDDYGTVNTSISGLTVERSLGDWPNNDDGTTMVGFNIYFDFDNYDTAFEISAQSGNVLTVIDPDGYMEDHFGASWAIKGVPKDEGAELQSLAIEIEDEGDANNNYRTGDDGANNP